LPVDNAPREWISRVNSPKNSRSNDIGDKYRDWIIPHSGERVDCSQDEREEILSGSGIMSSHNSVEDGDYDYIADAFRARYGEMPSSHRGYSRIEIDKYCEKLGLWVIAWRDAELHFNPAENGILFELSQRDDGSIHLHYANQNRNDVDILLDDDGNATMLPEGATIPATIDLVTFLRVVAQMSTKR
jgi:hypothetical protein